MVALAANEITIEQHFYPQQFAFLHDQSPLSGLHRRPQLRQDLHRRLQSVQAHEPRWPRLVAGPSFPQ
jgi:hypothetical protein